MAAKHFWRTSKNGVKHKVRRAKNVTGKTILPGGISKHAGSWSPGVLGMKKGRK